MRRIAWKGKIASNYQPIPIENNGQMWNSTWFPPTTVPEGKNHGAAGICLSGNNEIILISNDNVNWDIPAGRPNEGETPEETLRREMEEEACVSVLNCRLLGYYSSTCTKGHEKGLTLVRSFWQAHVLVKAWEPKHETLYRKVAPLNEMEAYIADTFKPFIFRALKECSGIN